jgi:hypothetical protein
MEICDSICFDSDDNEFNEIEYSDLLYTIINESKLNGKFIELFYLSSDNELSDMMWRFSKLPDQHQRIVKDLIALLSGQVEIQTIAA